MLPRLSRSLVVVLLAAASGCGGRTGLVLFHDAGRSSGIDADRVDAGHAAARRDGGPPDGGRADAGSAGDGGSGCNDDTSTLQRLSDGALAEEFVVVSIVGRGAPCGVYTFAHVGSLDPDIGPASVEIRRDGEISLVHTYPWRQTVSDAPGGLTATLAFEGLFDLTVRNAHRGTQNLYDLRTTVFGGGYAVVVP